TTPQQEMTAHVSQDVEPSSPVPTDRNTGRYQRSQRRPRPRQTEAHLAVPDPLAMKRPCLLTFCPVRDSKGKKTSAHCRVRQPDDKRIPQRQLGYFASPS